MRTAASPLRACRSLRSVATTTPLTLVHGPWPIRDPASTRAPAASRSALKEARHVLLPRLTAAARLWQRASAPASPPRLPVTLVLLVTKNRGPVEGEGVVLVSL